MHTKKVRLISAAIAGGLILTGATAAAIANAGHTPARAVLAADTASSPPVNLDNCPTLAEGYHGGCVDQLQTELNADDGDNLSVDGTFGTATQQAVEIFQLEHNIVPDGIVGPQTKAALDNPGPNYVATPTPGDPIDTPLPLSPATLPDLGTCPPMTLGYTVVSPWGVVIDPCVAALQASLKAVGFTKLDLDGAYGQQTWLAVWNFQTAHQLNATGNADAQTIALLNQVANSPAALTEDNGATANGGFELKPPAPNVPITIQGGDTDVHPEPPDVTVPDPDDDYVP